MDHWQRQKETQKSSWEPWTELGLQRPALHLKGRTYNHPCPPSNPELFHKDTHTEYHWLWQPGLEQQRSWTVTAACVTSLVGLQLLCVCMCVLAFLVLGVCMWALLWAGGSRTRVELKASAASKPSALDHHSAFPHPALLFLCSIALITV